MSLWKIAAVQIDNRLGDVAHNRATVRAGLRDAEGFRKGGPIELE